MDIYERMQALSITLPDPPAKGGLYTPAKRFSETLVYISGCGPSTGTPIVGRLGETYTLEEGQAFARSCMLNVLSVLQAHVGDLRRVKSAVKILTFVASADSFTQQPAVANGGSQLLLDLFGEEGLPARSAIGVNVLPGNMPVETEALFELYPEV